MTVPNGRTATYTYDGSGNLVKTVDLLGTAVSYGYDGDGYLTSMTVGSKTTTFSYTTGGNRKYINGVTDANGNKTTYSHDGSGLVSITDPSGRTTRYTNGSEGTGSVKDPLGNYRTMSYSDGLPVSLADSNGTYSMEYDGRGNLTKLTDPLGNETAYTYDADDNMLTMTDALNNIFSYAYDDKNNLTKMTTPLGRETAFTYGETGQLVAVSDPMHRTITLTYDEHGNVLTLTDPLTNVFTFGYDAAGIDLTSITDAGNNKYQLAYDVNRRLTRITYPDNTSRVFGYDAFAPLSMTDENGHTTSLQRDNLLRVTHARDALNNLTQLSYDAVGNLLTVVNALNHTTAFTYDALNRPVSRTDPLGNMIQFLYDASSNLTRLTDPKNNATSMQYDANKRLTAVTDPLGKQVRYARDALERISQKTNARGQTIGYAYDKDGLIQSKTYGGSDQAAYEYDQDGRLTSVVDGQGKTTFTNDALGRVTGIKYPNTLTAAFTYDSVGNMASIQYPGGLTVSYQYDSRNRLTNAAWSGASIALTYDAAGNLLTETRQPGGAVSSYSYDANNRLLLIDHRVGTSVVARMAFTRDALGHIISQDITHPAGLTPTFQSLTESWQYNAVNQMAAHASSALTYDADGNLVSAAGGAFTFNAAYDLENRPTEIIHSNLTNRYAYNGLGRRVRTEHNGVVRYAHYDPRDRLLFETDASGNLQAAYIHLGNRLAAMVASNKVYFYHFNQLGSAVALTDSNGATVNAYLYDDFGEILNKIEAVSNPFTYVGAFGVMDEGDGLYFMKNRYYHARLRRFLQKDPIGFAGGHNLYDYVADNPINFIDPLGLTQLNREDMEFLGKTNITVGGISGIAAVAGIAIIASCTLTGGTIIIGGATILSLAAYSYKSVQKGERQLEEAKTLPRWCEPKKATDKKYDLFKESPLATIDYAGGLYDISQGNIAEGAESLAWDAVENVAQEIGGEILTPPIK